MSAQLPQRLSAVMEKSSNKHCSECFEMGPTWACFLVNPLDQHGPRLGIFCCYRCYGYLQSLGKDVCQVKSTRSISWEWTQQEMEIMEQTGNQLVNAIYENRMTDEEKKKEQESDIRAFIEDKYQNFTYFSKAKYQQTFELPCTAPDDDLMLDDPTSRISAFAKHFLSTSSRKKIGTDSKQFNDEVTTKKPPLRGIKKALSASIGLHYIHWEVSRAQKKIAEDKAMNTKSSQAFDMHSLEHKPKPDEQPKLTAGGRTKSFLLRPTADEELDDETWFAGTGILFPTEPTTTGVSQLGNGTDERESYKNSRWDESQVDSNRNANHHGRRTLNYRTESTADHAPCDRISHVNGQSLHSIRRQKGASAGRRDGGQQRTKSSPSILFDMRKTLVQNTALPISSQVARRGSRSQKSKTKRSLIGVVKSSPSVLSAMQKSLADNDTARSSDLNVQLTSSQKRLNQSDYRTEKSKKSSPSDFLAMRHDLGKKKNALASHLEFGKKSVRRSSKERDERTRTSNRSRASHGTKSSHCTTASRCLQSRHPSSNPVDRRHSTSNGMKTTPEEPCVKSLLVDGSPSAGRKTSKAGHTSASCIALTVSPGSPVRGSSFKPFNVDKPAHYSRKPALEGTVIKKLIISPSFQDLFKTDATPMSDDGFDDFSEAFPEIPQDSFDRSISLFHACDYSLHPDSPSPSNALDFDAQEIFQCSAPDLFFCHSNYETTKPYCHRTTKHEEQHSRSRCRTNPHLERGKSVELVPKTRSSQRGQDHHHNGRRERKKTLDDAFATLKKNSQAKMRHESKSVASKSVATMSTAANSIFTM